MKHVPAVTGPTGRMPAFPAESVAWLTVVREEDEGAFAEALQNAGADSVVVWCPEEKTMPRALPLTKVVEVIEREYVPEKRFGSIEVRRRKPSNAPGTAK